MAQVAYRSNHPVDRSLAYQLGLNVFSLLGNTAMGVQPVLVGALVDYIGLTPREAGFVSAAEMGGFALGMTVLLAWVTRISPRALAAVSILIMVAANIVCSRAESFGLILMLCAINGMGAALAYSVFLRLAAATVRPERTFGVANSVSILCTGILVLMGPRVLESFGISGLLVGLSAFAALTTVALPLVPGSRSHLSVEADSTAYRLPLDLGARRSIGFVLLTMLFLYTGHSAIWSYQERIGVQAGLPADRIGLLIGISMMFWGVLGSVAAALCGMRIGRVWPQVISLGFSVVAAIALATSNGALAFGLASALVAFSWFYGLPYQMGLLAAFDPDGRANVAGSLLTTGGAAAGPFIGALIINPPAYSVLGVFAGMCYVLALGLVLPAALRFEVKAKRV